MDWGVREAGAKAEAEATEAAIRRAEVFMVIGNIMVYYWRI